MGANAARHTLEVLDNVRHVLAVELLAAAQAIDLRPDDPSRLGHGTSTLMLKSASTHPTWRTTARHRPISRR